MQKPLPKVEISTMRCSAETSEFDGPNDSSTSGCVFSRTRKTDGITMAKVKAASTELDLPAGCKVSPARAKGGNASRQTFAANNKSTSRVSRLAVLLPFPQTFGLTYIRLAGEACIAAVRYFFVRILNSS